MTSEEWKRVVEKNKQLVKELPKESVVDLGEATADALRRHTGDAKGD